MPTTIEETRSVSPNTTEQFNADAEYVLPATITDEECKEIYKAFGRGSAVGKAIFRLYNKKLEYKPTVKISTKPSNPDEEHKAKQAADRAARSKKVEIEAWQKPVKPVKAKKFFDAGMGRKSFAKINEEMKVEQSQVQPLRRSVSISRTELIQKLQSRCENPHEKGKLAPVRPERHSVAIPTPKLSEEAQLFKSIEVEIEERQTFLEEMRRLGHGSKHEATIKGEIAERVRELKRLDAILRGAV